MRRSVAFVLCLLLFPSSYALADFYRWIDQDGNEFFTNDQKQIPPQYREQTTVVKPDESRVSVSDKLSGTAPVVVKQHRDKYGKGEEYWRRRAENLRLKLRDKQGEYDLVVRQLDDQEEQAKKRPGKKSKSNASLGKKKMKLEKEIAALNRELEAELPEDARKADAYPGWIRE
jgi:hypothetical protein